MRVSVGSNGSTKLSTGIAELDSQDIQIYTDEKLDESYTPAKISIRAGTNFHDLHEVQLVDLEEPSGWVSISLAAASAQPGSGTLMTNTFS